MIHALDDDQALAAWATNPHAVLRTLSNRATHATHTAHGLAEFIDTARPAPARSVACLLHDGHGEVPAELRV
ncbi:hypothetical protein [Oerskovia paurometabola]|uniref:hypothetical protein n=1 Tax=Oerskovia paurometabola TaxID=162170 RepID=UPI00381F5922